MGALMGLSKKESQMFYGVFRYSESPNVAQHILLDKQEIKYGL